jgi:magnesium transporter
MSPDDRTALLEEVPSAAARQPSSPHPGRATRRASLLGYPEGGVGRLMTPDLIAVTRMTVKETLDYVRKWRGFRNN